jgi:CD2 antigen cytoplasmic tail-binding protein 2
MWKHEKWCRKMKVEMRFRLQHLSVTQVRAAPIMIFRADPGLCNFNNDSTTTSCLVFASGVPTAKINIHSTHLNSFGTMSRSVRPKRAGEDYARTHQVPEDEFAGPASSKKPRFDLRNPSALAPDELEDDAVLDADEIGRRGQGVRRNAVNLDGYQSDSENEGFNARVDAKAKAKRRQQREQAAGDDDEDMFASEGENEVEEEIGEEEAYRKNKKNVRFLKDEDIEGQVNSSRGGRSVHVDLADIDDSRRAEEVESESESEVDEAERARVDGDLDEEVGAGGKKTHAPLIDAFNMRSEQEEGRFDEQGNFVRKAADPDAIHDTWLDGVSKKDIHRAKEAAAKRENERRERDKKNDSMLAADILRTLIKHLQRGETTLEALGRLGKGLRKKPKWQSKQKNKRKNNGAGAEDVEMTEENPEEAARKKAIDEITGAADLLLSRGQTEIYDQEREFLTRQFRRETGEDWIDPPDEVDEAQNQAAGKAPADQTTLWEYRWSDARDGGETHGPYDGAMMQSWNDAGYFGEGVEFRKVGGAEGDWARVTIFS